MTRKYKRLRRKERKKRNKKILLFCLLLTLTLSVSYAAFNTLISIDVSGTAKRTDFYVSNTGSDDNGDGTLESPYLTIQKAYNEASKVANIYIMNDISQSTTINMDKEKKITLTSYSTNNIVHSVIKTAAINDYMINQSKGTLNLENIVLEGNNIEDTYGGIYISAILNVNNGATIENFVSSNAGGGIRSNTSPNITILGGEISNNTASYGGGIFTEGSGMVTISGGEISNNTATNNGGGLFIGTGSSLTISGGTISNNIATDYGGGICGYEIGTVTISGTALIDDNRVTSSSSNGGGMSVSSGKVFNMTGGTISNNYCAHCGGGIFLSNNSGSLVGHIISGGIITGNEAATNSGGILLYGSNAKLTMSGGTISDNKTIGIAAGIYVCHGSIFEMNGGMIKNNTTKNYGGVGVSSDSTFTKNGGTICGNTPSNSYDNPVTCPS